MAENSLWELACRSQAWPQPQVRLFSNGPGCQPHFTDAKQHARPIRGYMQGVTSCFHLAPIHMFYFSNWGLWTFGDTFLRSELGTQEFQEDSQTLHFHSKATQK